MLVTWKWWHIARRETVRARRICQQMWFWLYHSYVDFVTFCDINVMMTCIVCHLGEKLRELVASSCKLCLDFLHHCDKINLLIACVTVMLIMLVMMMWCHIVTLWGEKLCKRVASPSRFDFNLLHHGDKMWLNLLIACITTYAYVTWERNCHICQKMLFWFSTCREMRRVIICWSISKLWHI